MEYQFGQKIRDLRKYLRLTQGELANNICSQQMISKLENHEEVYPSAEILYHISKRLGVPMEYFFENNDLLNINYVVDSCEQIDQLIRKSKYEDAFELIKLEKNNPLFNKDHLRMYLLWREGICLGYLKNDFAMGIDLINQALKLSKTSPKNYSIEELDILTSKAIFHGKLKEWEVANNLYETIISNAERLLFLKDRSTLINGCYNASRTAYLLKDYEKAVELSAKGISICRTGNTFYLLGKLYYQKAQSLYKKSKGGSAEIMQLYQKALWIFEFEGELSNYAYVQRKLRKLKLIK